MIPISKIFIIAFPGNNEKKAKLFQARLRSIPLEKQTPIEIYEVPERSELNDALLKNGLQLFENTASGIDPEAISLAIGHWNVWQKALREKHQSILVLEEGFLPSADHYHILHATTELWEMIYLGRFSDGGDIPLGTGGLVMPGYSNGSFAYIINEAGIRKLMESGYDRHIIPVGEFLSAMHAAHPQPDIRSLFSDRLAALAPMKNFIEMDESWSLASAAPEIGAEDYRPLHPQLYEAFGDAESQWVKRYLNLQLVQKEFDLICDEPIDNVYSFPLFTPLFCKEIIAEAEHYGQWTNYRQKGDPSIDIMLNSFGLNDIYSHMMKKFLYPLFYHKYQLNGKGWEKLNSQNFIVRYLSEEQGHLGLHNDGSYLSMVVTLNTDYEGGGTIFPKFKKLIKHNQPGYASIHPGLVGYLHGARPVTDGRRYILASFFFMGEKPPFSEGAY